MLTIDKATGRLIGRGSSDDKGPVLGWVNVLEAHKSLGLELPVNLKFCFEGMEESGSEGLDELILSEVKKGKEGWFDGVDCVCIVSDPIPFLFCLWMRHRSNSSLTITGSMIAPPRLPTACVEFPITKSIFTVPLVISIRGSLDERSTSL